MISAGPRRWYAPGLRFSCLRCGRCCHQHGDHRWIHVTDVELAAVSALLETGPEVQQVGGRRALRFRDGRCPLHCDAGCTAYSARPLQCCTWPFWPENVYSQGAWKRRVVSLCPGADQGRLWAAKEVEQMARLLREADRGA